MHSERTSTGQRKLYFIRQRDNGWRLDSDTATDVLEAESCQRLIELTVGLLRDANFASRVTIEDVNGVAAADFQFSPPSSRHEEGWTNESLEA